MTQENKSEMILPDTETLVASAARFLIDGGENEAALILASCKVTLQWHEDFAHEGQFVAIFSGPRAIYDVLRDQSRPEEIQILNAFNAVAPLDLRCRYLGCTVEQVRPEEMSPDWRRQIAEIAEGKAIHNQGRQFGQAPRFEWRNLYFRSEAERRVAIALEQVGVLFFPNCMGRITTESGERETREADFLVCDRGKWGILEIDGQTYHRTAAIDHRRDRGFRIRGIPIVERFTATECQEDAPRVVKTFLQVLHGNR